jgi:hypothetical protein
MTKGVVVVINVELVLSSSPFFFDRVENIRKVEDNLLGTRRTGRGSEM